MRRQTSSSTVTRLEVTGQLLVDDGRFYVGIVAEGSGTLESDGGSQGLALGEAFVCPATLPHVFAAGGSARFTVIRCMESRLAAATR